MDIKIEIELTHQDLENLFVGALEGGSNYWYYLPDDFNNPKGEPLSTWLFDQVMNDGLQVKVEDLENEGEFLGWINKENVIRGTKLLSKHPDHLGDLLKENSDATTADVWFQLVVLGEIIYG